jgi:hypothetical protein
MVLVLVRLGRFVLKGRVGLLTLGTDPAMRAVLIRGYHALDRSYKVL